MKIFYIFTNIENYFRQLFHGLHSLEKLHMKKNYLKSISDHSFASLKKLMVVDLSNNHLMLQSNDKDSRFESKSPFYDCILLKELDLSYNNIFSVKVSICTIYRKILYVECLKVVIKQQLYNL